jgi:thioester reductase-like protein
MFDRILLSGGSGAVGSHVLQDLRTSHPSAEIYCLARSRSAGQKISDGLGKNLRNRVRIVYADLTKAADGLRLAEELGRTRRALAVHCAADVSWTKSERLLAPINVDGSIAFADLAVRVSRERPSFVFLSTAFLSDDGQQRNAYEATKLAAEKLLCGRHGRDLQLSVIRCSLIVGDSVEGRISRFNGLYPLIRLVALGEVPCVIADRNYRIDIVPVDFVSRQIVVAAATEPEPQPLQLLVAAGESGSVAITDLVQRVQTRTSQFRAANGLRPSPEVSVINSRQYRFLMKASQSWDMTQRFERVEQISGLMAGYIAHGETGRAIVPRTLGEPPPDPQAYLDVVVDYWLAAHRQKVLADMRHEWLEGVR